MKQPKKPPTSALRFIVNGVEHTLTVRNDAPLYHAVAVALHETAQIGQPAEAWEVRDASGVLIDQRINVVGVAGESVLYLTPQAGVGGAVA